MKVFNRAHLPEKIRYNKKDYFFNPELSMNVIRVSSYVNSIIVAVMSKNLGGKLDLHNKEYTPTKFVFTAKKSIMKELNIELFVRSYLATAAWAENLEGNEFTREAQATAKRDCKAFIKSVTKHYGKEKANELLTIKGSDLDYLAPHDFYLTRNGHGTGFWDRTEVYGEDDSKVLTNISEEAGYCSAIMTSKGKLSLF